MAALLGLLIGVVLAMRVAAINDAVLDDDEENDVDPAWLREEEEPLPVAATEDAPAAEGDTGTVFDGTIPGCARRLWRCTGSADPAAALLCGSAHPAKLLGLTRQGTLAPGADADLMLLDPTELTVRACFVRGTMAWADQDLHGALWYHS